MGESFQSRSRHRYKISRKVGGKLVRIAFYRNAGKYNRFFHYPVGDPGEPLREGVSGV
jgi:hypothetical protein